MMARRDCSGPFPHLYFDINLKDQLKHSHGPL